MGDELKWILKGMGISRLFCHVFAYANGVCLHLLVPPLAQFLWCFLLNDYKHWTWTWIEDWGPKDLAVLHLHSLMTEM